MIETPTLLISLILVSSSLICGLFVYIFYGVLVELLDRFFKKIIENLKKKHVIQEYRAEVRTYLAKLIELRKRNDLYKNIYAIKLNSILNVKKIDFLKEIKLFLEILVENSGIFKDLNMDDTNTFVDVGTCGHTAIFCVLGIHWHGFNGEKAYTKALKYLDQFKKMMLYHKKGSVNPYPENYPPKENPIKYDISFMRLTLHHLGDESEDRIESIKITNKVLECLWKNTKKRIFLYDWIIREDGKDVSPYLDNDGGEYLSLSDFLKLELISSNINDLKFFSEEESEWFNFLLKSQNTNKTPFTFGDFFKCYLDKKNIKKMP